MVQQRASLAITHVLLRAALSVSGDGASLNLVDCTLHPAVRVTATGGSTLTLASMTVPFQVWAAADDALADPGSTMRFESVRIGGYASWGELTGTEIIEADGTKTKDPPNLGSPASGTFIVTSGCSAKGLTNGRDYGCIDDTPPCNVTRGGRCVGRTEGYGPYEDCAITVGGGGGALGPCAVFDAQGGSTNDYISLPGGATHDASDCPNGAALAPGDAIAWHSDGNMQGSQTGNGVDNNGCAAKGTCARPWSRNGLGGGWELCFA